MVLAREEFTVLHSRYDLLRNNLNVAPNDLFLLFLPLHFALSLLGTLAFLPLMKHNKHTLLVLGSLYLYILTLDICIAHTPTSSGVC